MIRVGGFVLDGPTEHGMDVFGQSPDKNQTTGVANSYLVEGPGDVELIIHDTKWKDGTRSITTESTNGNLAIERLEHGLSLGIRAHGNLQFCELRQARITKQGPGKPWSQLFKASIAQLNQGAGLKVVKVLEDEGAIGVGTKEAILGETNRRRMMLCATFLEESQIFPSVAYLLTRVIPLCNGFSVVDVYED